MRIGYKLSKTKNVFGYRPFTHETMLLSGNHVSHVVVSKLIQRYTYLSIILIRRKISFTFEASGSNEKQAVQQGHWHKHELGNHVS